MRAAVVFGTRPEAIKLAPVIRELEASATFEPFVIGTGQHGTMLDATLAFLGIELDADLQVARGDGALHALASQVLERLGAVLRDAGAELIVVQGDTTTTLAASLAGLYAELPVAHVEAGLRTHDPRLPYPEEVNRRLTTQLARYHFAPTVAGRANLLAEQVPPERVFVSGNTVVDALLWAIEQGGDFEDASLRRLEADLRPVVLVTTHRRESWGAPLAEMAAAVAEIARLEPGVQIVFPVHANPTVAATIRPAVAGLPNVLVLDPLPYGEFVRLLRRADIVLTDSGGLQEEGPALGTPVLVMRTVTERPEAVAAGAARLVGTTRTEIVGAVRDLLHDESAYTAMASAPSPYGDGRAAERIVGALAHYLGDGVLPPEFGG